MKHSFCCLYHQCYPPIVLPSQDYKLGIGGSFTWKDESLQFRSRVAFSSIQAVPLSGTPGNPVYRLIFKENLGQLKKGLTTG